ncbi:efflux RND transporter periplasmic adaptor subunit [Methylosoma difficile]
MKKHVNFIVVVLGLIFAIMVLYNLRKSHQLLTDASVARSNGQPIPVSVYSAASGNIYALTAFECQAAANPQLVINSPLMNAIVQDVPVSIGDRVKKGQLLVKLDDRAYRATIDNLSKELQFLSATVSEQANLADYYKTNLDRGLVKEADFRKAKVDWLKAQSEHQQTQRLLSETSVDLEKTAIVSQVDGIVTDVTKVGQVSTIRDSLVSVAVINPMLLECAMSDTDYALLGDNKTALPVKVSFPALAGHGFQGQVKRVQPLANYEQRMVNIDVELNNDDGLILPGMAATGQIINDLNTMRIPAVSLISTRNNESTVFVVDDSNIAKQRTIQTGVISSGYAEVKSGLKANDRVVVAGQVELQEGDKVSVVEPAEELQVQ